MERILMARGVCEHCNKEYLMPFAFFAKAGSVSVVIQMKIPALGLENRGNKGRTPS